MVQTKVLLFMVLLCNASFAKSPLHKFFRVTQAALIAGQSLDCASSWGKYELNPILRSHDGTFGARGLSLKMGITAGTIAAEWFIKRKSAKAETFLIPLNLSVTGLFAGQAVHNWSLKP